MSENPLNLVLRFLLEITALIAIGYGSWHASEGFLRYLLAIGLPLFAAYLWASYRTPNEAHPPTHRTRPIPGWGRLLIEVLTFGGGAWGFFSTGATTMGWIYTILLMIHHALSYDRVIWLLRH